MSGWLVPWVVVAAGMGDDCGDLMTTDPPSIDLPSIGVVRILSDLHIGHPGSIFRSVDELEPLLDGINQLVLNGDSTEDCSSELADASQRSLVRLIDLAETRGVAVTRTRGNHDPLVEDHGYIRVSGRAVLVTHGDACFPYGSPWSGGLDQARPALEQVARDHGAAEITTLDQRLALARDWAQCFHPPVRAVTSRMNGLIRVFARAFWPPHAGWRLVSTRLAALRYVDDFLDQFAPETQVMVFGHIHRAGVWRRKSGRVLINTGAFQPLAGRLACDLSSDGITVRRIDRVDGRFQTTKTVWCASWDDVAAR